MSNMLLILAILVIKILLDKGLAFILLPLTFKRMGPEKMASLSDEEFTSLLVKVFLLANTLTALLAGVMVWLVYPDPGLIFTAVVILFSAACLGTWLNWERKKEELLTKLHKLQN